MEKTKYEGKFIKVTEELIGKNTWERVYLSDGVQVFPITSDGKIKMIEERRPHEKHPIRLKFVTGLMDEDEDPLETANREMQEEIGFKAQHLEVLIHREATGTVNNNFYQVIATGLSEYKIPNPDGEDTIVSIKEFTIEEIEQLLEDEKLPWSMGALGIFKLKKLIQSGKISF
ncbi:MAG: ADP-ribose pyrophosphatase [Bacteriovoracaceae bacterium]|jgi:ADP-ribose pyrophosphatase